MAGFSANLEKIIVERGLSVASVARGAGVGSHILYDILRRGNEPKGDTLIKLSQFLNISPTELLTGKPDPRASQKEALIKQIEQADAETVDLFAALIAKYLAS